MRGYPPTLCLGSWRAAIRLDFLIAVKFALGLCHGSRGYVNIVGLVQFGFSFKQTRLCDDANQVISTKTNRL